MVKLSWFLIPIHTHKSKKIVQQAGGAVQTSHPVHSEDQKLLLPTISTSTYMNTDENRSFEDQNKLATGKSLYDSSCKPDICSEESQESLMKKQQDLMMLAKIRKSKSLGNFLDKETDFVYGDMVQEDELDKELSFHKIHQINNKGNNNPDEYYMGKGCKLQNQNGESYMSESRNVSCVGPVHHVSLFSIGPAEQSDAEHHDYADDESTDHVSSEQMSSDAPPIHAKCCSLTEVGIQAVGINDSSLKMKSMGPHSRSVGNMFCMNDEKGQILEQNVESYSMVALNRQKAPLDAHYVSQESDIDEQGSTCRQSQLVSNHSFECSELSDQEKDVKHVIKKSDRDNQLVDSEGSHCNADSREKCYHTSYSVGYCDMDDEERDDKYLSEKEKCDVPSIAGNDPNSSSVRSMESGEPGAGGTVAFSHKEGVVGNWDGLNHEGYNMRRVAAWINQLDVENCNIVEEVGESSNFISDKEPAKVALTGSKKLDAQNNLGMVVAYNYLSTLSPATSTAQMANFGLVAIPVLSAFAGLKMLNLSGNAIIRITTGALPKGLHMLNLSKNNISVIEGLKELTRLRVLDLSYNKISRIGHGLASCSTLKELYFAGNKISEIDGLHRLLKLSILDLRLNRISTSKGLQQLAANYASLQAINLEGNPAQKNVGDEQLKKYLSSLLPHLAYYNKQVIRAKGSKEVSDRAGRSFSSHQFDRSFRSEHRESRRGSRSIGHNSYGNLKNAMNSSIRSSRSMYKPLALMAPKPTNLPNASRNIQAPLQPGISLRRIQSEGAL
ncbi:putative serine/threonine-protein kinase [Canna indica]|uniref:Serine/threonine-protein kinase n=1 Tax=Canna indica TaxID=4628 RepID=A0AAQ3QJ04_9LILI|nr:putative serine/threonine-protein kinase [Canna indica]